MYIKTWWIGLLDKQGRRDLGVSLLLTFWLGVFCLAFYTSETIDAANPACAARVTIFTTFAADQKCF